ncbi:CRTAC1 family protein [Aliikangiella sp. G2MR2-5]|uniref:CRTAC1 family protein n=1 Tax=Aliikangiella sp. G2MR2-5 TaxID=2788943 RepID=UPI0018A8C22C|nr:CRTAC1 family protein [Aliikangiella sp. G2MR2-5]
MQLSSIPIKIIIVLILSYNINTLLVFAAEKRETTPPIFEDITSSSGINFVHFNGMTGEYYFPEMTGSGGALFDYDNDGDLDLYLVQGNLLGKKDSIKQAMFPIQGTPRDRLFRNNLISGSKQQSSVSFTDITEQSGLNIQDYGMGVATGDYNNDGWIDLLITNYGKNRLLKNNGDGTFTDESLVLEKNDNRWSTSATFFDFDKDGYLDIYIANYVEYDVNNKKDCYARSSRQDYCGPAAFIPQVDTLYHNQGNGTFKDVTQSLLRDYKAGPGLGVVTADFNGDGWIDIYVANDGAANQLWLNRKGKFFEDDALFSGTSVNSDGKAEASMGIDAADFDNDGDTDLFMTHLMGETNTLYRNDGSGIFEDITQDAGLGLSSLPYTAFGTAWLDFDNDAFLDLIILNGAVATLEHQLKAGENYPLKQPNQIFKNIDGKRFQEIDDNRVLALKQQNVSRGAAFGDIDNDGDMDFVIFNNNGPVKILLNNVGQKNSWIGFRLTDKLLKRDSHGAQVELKFKNKNSMWRRVRTDGSYCSANDPRVLIGLHKARDIESIYIHWPDGSTQEVKQFSYNNYQTIQKLK